MWTQLFKHRKRVLFSDKQDWKKAILKRIDSDTYLPFFDDIRQADLSRYDLVIPLKLADVEFLSDHRSSLTGCNFLTPPVAAIETCNDKTCFNRFLLEHGHGRFLPEVTDKPAFPYILKKKIDAWGLGSIIIRDEETERQHHRELNSDDYFVQAYITGKTEYTTHLLMRHGRIVFARTIEFSFDDDYFVKGQRYRYASKRDIRVTPFLERFSAILDDLNYEGICCFNYKIHDNRPLIFEVNPRYGSSMSDYLPDLMRAYDASLDPVSSENTSDWVGNMPPLTLTPPPTTKIPM